MRFDAAPLLTRTNAHQIARQTGMTARTIQRYKTDGLTHNQADRIAVALGRHPSELWTDWLTCP